MAAFVSSQFRHNPIGAAKFYEWAIQLLDEGRRVWKNVPKAQRGAIFDDTFARAVRGMYIGAYIQVRDEFLDIVSA